jgi:RHS repeat-associated protein
MIARLTAQPACDYDADRAEDLPTADENHPDHDPAWPDGYETPSTGFLQVGARDYDPDLGRWLQPDPEPVGPELQWGQNNRWAYCANDPVNASDPTGRLSGWDFFAIAITLGIVMTGVIMMASGLPLQGLAMILGALEFLLDWFADQATDCIERLRMHAIASTLYGLAFALLSGGLLFASSLPAILGTLGGALVALRGFGLEIRDLTNDVSTAGGSFW